MPEIRQDIGICLQHDCLFPQLTVREHIQFFARLKGLYRKVSTSEAERQVDQALIDVALSEKRSTLSKNLSGGMKRKLSVAMAFCGGSKIVMLDEPTSGMDPYSRRFTWNVIRNYKRDRIIILTTHFMDEADILGDRIAIMAEGQLRCIGSSLFLKKTYGVGYQLTIDGGQRSARHDSDKPDNSSQERLEASVSDVGSVSNSEEVGMESKITRIVNKFVREAVVLSDVGSGLSYRLPLNTAHLFAPMFMALDEQIQEALFSSYGVSMTTLNEVFLLVTRGAMPIDQGFGSASSENLKDSLPAIEEDEDCEANGVEQTLSSLMEFKSVIELDHQRRFARHVVALMKKRGLYFRRDKKAWICTTIVPSMFVLVGFLIFALTSPKLNMVPLTINPSDYNNDVGLNQITFNSPESPFLCQPGICSHRQPYYMDTLVDEQYAFCGYQAKLGISVDGFNPTNQTCTVPDSAKVISTLESSDLIVNDAIAQSIYEVSSHLLIESTYFLHITLMIFFFSRAQLT
jgi:ATP-binding cassette, subfamily A (ABC1), member 3